MATTEYPKLMWRLEDNEEITIHDAEQERRLLAGGYTLTPPIVVPVSAMDAMRAKLEALSPEDRKLLVEAQRNDRLRALQAEMAALPDASLTALLAEKTDRAKTPRKL